LFPLKCERTLVGCEKLHRSLLSSPEGNNPSAWKLGLVRQSDVRCQEWRIFFYRASAHEVGWIPVSMVEADYCLLPADYECQVIPVRGVQEDDVESTRSLCGRACPLKDGIEFRTGSDDLLGTGLVDRHTKSCHDA